MLRLSEISQIVLGYEYIEGTYGDEPTLRAFAKIFTIEIVSTLGNDG